MKLPKCRTCGSRHRLGDPCVYGKPIGDGLIHPLGDLQRATDTVVAPNEAAPLNDAALERLRGYSTPLGVVIGKGPLTPAQKQGAYREKGGNRVREANRLRMRAKRGK